MKPLVSLIVPVLNVEKYLEQCLTSISDQTYDNFEVILVVGKCSDNSEVICEKWCEKDNRFRTVPQLKACLGYARNVGIDAAKGDYIAFCDSDDCITPDFLSCFVDTALKNDSDIVETQFTLCDEKLNSIYDYDRNSLGYEMGHDFLEYTSAPSACKYFVKRDIFSNNGLRYPEIRFGEDISMYSLLFSHCKKIDYVEKATYLYRKVPSSLMNNPQGRRNRYESLFDIINFATNEFKTRSLFEKSWLKLLFQLEMHSASIIQDSAISDDEALAMRQEISDFFKKSFPVWQTIYDVTAIGWGGEVASSIASKLSSLHGVQPTTMFNRYFFELLDNAERKKLEKMITSASPDVFMIDLISEAHYLSTYTGDLGTYVKNWKLGFNAFMQIVQITSNNASVFLLENYLSPVSDPARNLNAILKMLYDDIKMNYPEIVNISAIPDALQNFNDQELSCLYQLKLVSDKLHTIDVH
ncbi:MAG: glycosyltransferase [Butyrivibrio sp.]|nr:glycosyltransferase [Butyrivibrio sp.]MBR1642991.1 glycosyltransferase [Butyrivibrio sp.]